MLLPRPKSRKSLAIAGRICYNKGDKNIARGRGEEQIWIVVTAV